MNIGSNLTGSCSVEGALLSKDCAQGPCGLLEAYKKDCARLHQKIQQQLRSRPAVPRSPEGPKQSPAAPLPPKPTKKLVRPPPRSPPPTPGPPRPTPKLRPRPRPPPKTSSPALPSQISISDIPEALAARVATGCTLRNCDKKAATVFYIQQALVCDDQH